MDEHAGSLNYRPVSWNFGKLVFVTILLCLFLSEFAISQEQGYIKEIRRNILFSTLSLKDGLPQTTVNAVTQDHKGYMWFGTQEGLSRYNGYRFDNFFHDADNPSSLSHGRARWPAWISRRWRRSG